MGAASSWGRIESSDSEEMVKEGMRNAGIKKITQTLYLYITI
jgi:hypothetical protein